MHYEAQLWVSPTDSSQTDLLTTVIDLQLNKLQSGTHRTPAQELSDFSMFMAIIHSTSLLLLPFLSLWQTDKSQLWCPKQSCPGTVAIQCLLVILEISLSAPSGKLEISLPHLNIQNIFSLVEEGFADISEMWTAAWSCKSSLENGKGFQGSWTMT